ncbi:hypothetical protein ACFXO9_30960 [Nocardia tengchongensis]|uniref:hypothetical protein n=1 Tax=Nocardia tengchongensis TaxID=2055889 RepID=UPI0036CAEFE5
MALEVLPEELPVISAQLGANCASLTSVLSTAAASLMPVSYGIDSVGLWVHNTLTGFNPRFFGATEPGIANMLPAADCLVQIGNDYAAADATGGAAVDARAAHLAAM